MLVPFDGDEESVVERPWWRRVWAIATAQSLPRRASKTVAATARSRQRTAIRLKPTRSW
jgi:hypothetical protein